MTDELVIRTMTRSEVDVLVGWAAGEGWNPGLHDAESFWVTDSEAFVAAELAGELVGGGAITSYGGEYGFMGFFIVRPEFRGRGLGNALWHARLDRLRGRLRPGAPIGLDGVFEMQEYYARGGFAFSHRSIRYRSEPPHAAVAPLGGDDDVIPAGDVPFDEILAYDRACFPAPRAPFLERWLAQPDALALTCRRNGSVGGFGVVRRCREGCKIGPLFAEDAPAAERLFAHLARFAADGPLFLDAPENNPAAIELVRRHRMVEVFGCARMYVGAPPELASHRIFGVTTFELG